MYREMQINLVKKDFPSEERYEMLKDIMGYIQEKNFRSYHDLMEDICMSHTDWFTLLTFDRKGRYAVVEYINSSRRLTKE